jgi:hypothetical protein
VQKSGNTFSFTLTPQAAEELGLVDGSYLDIQPSTESTQYAFIAKVVKAHREPESRPL